VTRSYATGPTYGEEIDGSEVISALTSEPWGVVPAALHGQEGHRGANKPGEGSRRQKRVQCVPCRLGNAVAKTVVKRGGESEGGGLVRGWNKELSKTRFAY